MESSRFTTFSQGDYDKIYDRLVEDADGIASGILDDTDVDSADEIPVSIVTVQTIGE